MIFVSFMLSIFFMITKQHDLRKRGDENICKINKYKIVWGYANSWYDHKIAYWKLLPNSYAGNMLIKVGRRTWLSRNLGIWSFQSFCFFREILPFYNLLFVNVLEAGLFRIDAG